MKSRVRKTAKPVNQRKRKGPARKAQVEKKPVAKAYDFKFDLDAAMAPSHGS